MDGEVIRMTVGGWVFMGAAWAGVLGLMIYCLVKMLSKKPPGTASDKPVAEE